MTGIFLSLVVFLVALISYPIGYVRGWKDGVSSIEEKMKGE